MIEIAVALASAVVGWIGKISYDYLANRHHVKAEVKKIEAETDVLNVTAVVNISKVWQELHLSIQKQFEEYKQEAENKHAECLRQYEECEEKFKVLMRKYEEVRKQLNEKEKE